MKQRLFVLSLLLCFCLSLCLVGCDAPPDATDPTIPSTGTTDPTTKPTDPTVSRPTDPTEPPLSPEELYLVATEQLNALSDLSFSFHFAQNRVVSGETYFENRTGTALYSGLNSAALQAWIQEDVTYGGYNTQYTQSYINGKAYAMVNQFAFQSPISAQDFLAMQIPTILMDGQLYDSVSVEYADDVATVTFSGATALERWVTTEAAELVSASGTATIDGNRNLVSSTYTAQYTLGGIPYTLEVTVSPTAETPDFTDMPQYEESTPTLADLRAPRFILQTVGDVYTSQSITATYSDTLYSPLFAVVRSQNSTYNAYGSGESFMALLNSEVTLTDYAGHEETNSQSDSFLNGIYSNTVNGNTSFDESITADTVRRSCENAILSSLFSLQYIANAEITDTGDFLCIQFTGSRAFSDELCHSIYIMFQMNLDNWADSIKNDAITGYLTINKYTGLPTAMGMEMQRTHVKDSVSYTLTYQLDQSLQLSSKDAYQNITGETLPEDTVEGATPLFYKVTGKNGETLWLLGTIHIGDGRTAALPQQIVDAFASANALAVEFDPEAFEQALAADSSLQEQLVAAYYYTMGTIKDYLSKDLYNQLSPLILASGAHRMNCETMRVILWENQIENLFLREGSHLTAQQGMDQRLLAWAKAQGKPIYEIESGLSQVKVLTGFSKDLQNMLLQQTLSDGMLQYCADLELMYDLWCRGDEAALQQLLAEDTSTLTSAEKKLYNEYVKEMYTDRHKNMLTKAKNYLKSDETVFYAVGIAHLLGDNGLVESLTAAGYTVELVSFAS